MVIQGSYFRISYGPLTKGFKISCITTVVLEGSAINEVCPPFKICFELSLRVSFQRRDKLRHFLKFLHGLERWDLLSEVLAQYSHYIVIVPELC